MADIDRIEELMFKHNIEATAMDDEEGHYTGYYRVDGDDFLGILELAERVKELENSNNNTITIAQNRLKYIRELQEEIFRYKQALELIYKDTFHESDHELVSPIHVIRKRAEKSLKKERE